MKNQLLLIPALLFCINAAAQNTGGRITGIVVDEAEDTPLTGASIVLKEIQEGKVADIDGKFTFSNLPEATYTVLVDLIGYDPQEKTVRSTGGVGSASRLSVRGLEGKRIGFFIDEAPMNDQSDFLDLNDIPVDMIDRIEIYKGVVPAKFGGSAMGGAVNIVLKEYPDHLAWPSNTTKAWCISPPSA